VQATTRSTVRTTDRLQHNFASGASVWHQLHARHSSRRKNFSSRVRGACAHYYQRYRSCSTRVTTWRLAFICQRSIPPLRRRVYWPHGERAALEHTAPDRRYLIDDSEKEKPGVFPADTLNKKSCRHFGVYLLGCAALLLRAKNDDSHDKRWSRHWHWPVHGVCLPCQTGIHWRAYHVASLLPSYIWNTRARSRMPIVLSTGTVSW